MTESANAAAVALQTALARLRDEAKLDAETSTRAQLAKQLALEVDDILRRWAGELAISEPPSE